MKKYLFPLLLNIAALPLFTACAAAPSVPGRDSADLSEQVSDPASLDDFPASPDTQKEPVPDKISSVSTCTGPISLTYTDSRGYTIPYCLYLPSTLADNQGSDVSGIARTADTESYPLVLFLHGAGERGDDNLAQTNDTGIVPHLIDETFYSRHPSIILAPQCPEDAQWVDTPWEEGSYSIDEISLSSPLSAVTELLHTVRQDYPVDQNRIYGTGVSMGGYGTWDMLLRNPDLFAGAIILCGAGDPNHAADIKDIPLWVFHGAKDEEVPVSGSREMVQALEEASSLNLHYTEYSDIGHWIWLNAYDEPGLLEGLFSSSRQDR